ncbi:MAG: hypothetical protein KY456_06445 [Chloroflexi bacterium]|nr:hypothetical protein [Chloroflexota bacterium]
MNIFLNLDSSWANPAAVALMIAGLLLMVRGLRGGRDGARALLGQRTDMLSRIEGFRLTVFGLVLIGVGAAVMWQARWLLLLALGIGFVEILESSTLIAVWKWGRRTESGQTTTLRPSAPRSPQPTGSRDTVVALPESLG